MSFLNDFPHVRQYDGDLGWMIRHIQGLTQKLENFVNYNSIKYHDPIAWDISTQYEANTVVINPADGTAYISVQPVPSGILVTDSDYWTPIYNYAESMDKIRAQIAAANEGTRTTASAARRENDLVWINGYLYKVLYDIAAGTEYIPGVNIEPVTIEELIGDNRKSIAEIQEKISGRDVASFGATGDGVTDDSQAFMAADASDADYITVSPGTYAIHDVTFTKPLLMEPGAILKYNGETGGTMLTLSGDDNVYEINADFDGTSPQNGIAVSGNHNHFKTIDLRNLAYTGTQNANRGVYVTGSHNTFDFVRTENFTQNAAGNDSCPQGIALEFTATGNYFADVYTRNGRAGIVNAAGNDTVNGIGVYRGYNMHDNGVYHVRGGHLDVSTIEYEGDNECCAVIDDLHSQLSAKSTANIGAIVSNNCEQALRVHDAKWVNVGSMLLGTCQHAFVVQGVNVESGHVYIGNLSIKGHVVRPLYCPTGRGVLHSLTIDNITINDTRYDTDGFGGYFDLSVCRSVNIGYYDLRITGVTGDANVYHILPDLAEKSRIGKVRNRSTYAGAMIFRNAAQEMLEITNGLYMCDSTNKDLTFYNTGQYEDGLWSRFVPQYGYFKAGTVMKLSRDQTLGNIIICVESGSPGSWKEYTPYPMTEAVRYHQGAFQYWNGSAWTATS